MAVESVSTSGEMKMDLPNELANDWDNVTECQGLSSWT